MHCVLAFNVHSLLSGATLFRNACRVWRERCRANEKILSVITENIRWWRLSPSLHLLHSLYVCVCACHGYRCFYFHWIVYEKVFCFRSQQQTELKLFDYLFAINLCIVRLTFRMKFNFSKFICGYALRTAHAHILRWRNQWLWKIVQFYSRNKQIDWFSVPEILCAGDLLFSMQPYGVEFEKCKKKLDISLANRNDIMQWRIEDINSFCFRTKINFEFESETFESINWKLRNMPHRWSLGVYICIEIYIRSPYLCEMHTQCSRL